MMKVFWWKKDSYMVRMRGKLFRFPNRISSDVSIYPVEESHGLIAKALRYRIFCNCTFVVANFRFYSAAGLG